MVCISGLTGNYDVPSGVKGVLPIHIWLRHPYHHAIAWHFGSVRCSITPSTVGSTHYEEFTVPVLMGKGADRLMWLDFIQIPHE